MVHPPRRRRRARSLTPVLFLALLPLLPGCFGKPDKTNITLRKKQQDLTRQVEQLKRERVGYVAQIKALQSQSGGGVQTLPPERLDNLFTTHGIALGRLTGGADLDRQKPGDEGLKVYATPIDQQGQKLKAAGSFVVEAFDLAAPGDNRVGRWAFDVKQARDAWNGMLLQYGYVLTLPWQQKPPAHGDVTLKVTFTDELTGRSFTQQKVVKVNLPPGSEGGRGGGTESARGEG